MNSNPKSATTAGLLGIFLGGVGAHNWYLGEKKLGIIHTSLSGAGIAILILADAILPSVMSFWTLIEMAWLFTILNGIAWLLISGSSLWGFIEGITILTKGDAGLAQRKAAYGNTSPISTQPLTQSRPTLDNWQQPVAAPGFTTTNQDTSVNPVGQSFTKQPMLSAPAATKPPKQPMDPAKKRKLVRSIMIVLSIILVVAVGSIAASILLKVDYGETYRAAKALKPEVEAVYQNTSCERAIEYVDNTYTKPIDYNKYVEQCLAASGDTSALTQKLGETAGVKRNQEIKDLFDHFSDAVNQSLPDKEELAQRLALYQAWHEYEYLRASLKTDRPDSAIQAAVAPLLNSNNATLKTYGENWQQSILAVTQAYRNYDNLSFSDPNKTSARITYQNLQTDHNNWVATNKPDITQIGGLDFDNNTELYRAWTKLYNLIKDTYEQNYNSDSGDCSELFGEVYCD